MNAAHFFVAVIALAILPFAGCHKQPEVPPSLPHVQRPVLILNLKPGARLKLPIPRQALVERGGIPGVFVLSATGEARFRMVRAGRTNDAQVEILSGLHGDETLVLGDLSAVHDGSPIKVLETADTRG
ncbi:MAG: hypothetical protein Q7J84_02375 [Sulfuricaulis sp.]|nr:hypothetical protein [Sulfuricaulis sp.]